MSHEIRTPMNGIMVMAELLTAGALPARQRRFAEIIAKSGQSLLAIINDILDFSKIEAGKIELEQAPVDLNEIAENVVSLFAERARSKSIDLAAVVDPERAAHDQRGPGTLEPDRQQSRQQRAQVHRARVRKARHRTRSGRPGIASRFPSAIPASVFRTRSCRRSSRPFPRPINRPPASSAAPASA